MQKYKNQINFFYIKFQFEAFSEKFTTFQNNFGLDLGLGWAGSSSRLNYI